MKICWDNLEKLRYHKEKKCWYNKQHRTKVLYNGCCNECKEPFLFNHNNDGDYCCNECRNTSKDYREKISEKGIPEYREFREMLTSWLSV